MDQYGSVWIISRRFYTILYLLRVQAVSAVDLAC